MSKQAKRKLMRSGTQECPVCGRTAALVEHHIHGREIRRWNEPWNIAWICPVCHDAAHVDPPLIVIEGWVSTTKGKTLIWREAGKDPIALEAAKPPGY